MNLLLKSLAMTLMLSVLAVVLLASLIEFDVLTSVQLFYGSTALILAYGIHIAIHKLIHKSLDNSSWIEGLAILTLVVMILFILWIGVKLLV